MKLMVVLALLMGGVGVGPANAATAYPEHPVRLIVPYAAGGAADSVARVGSQKMTEELGQPIIVENRAGADGNIGADVVAHAAPDGYTILLGDVGNLTMGPAVRRVVPYDAVRD